MFDTSVGTEAGTADSRTGDATSWSRIS